jgi:hypothetical protein
MHADKMHGEQKRSWDISTWHFGQVTRMNNDAGSSGPRAHGAEGDRVIPKTAARQGVTGHNVRYVLIISTVAAIVALTIAYYLVLS